MWAFYEIFWIPGIEQERSVCNCMSYRGIKLSKECALTNDSYS